MLKITFFFSMNCSLLHKINTYFKSLSSLKFFFFSKYFLLSYLSLINLYQSNSTWIDVNLMIKNSYTSSQNEILFGSLDHSVLVANLNLLTLKPYFKSYVSALIDSDSKIASNNEDKLSFFKIKQKIHSNYFYLKQNRLFGLYKNFFLIYESVNDHLVPPSHTFNDIGFNSSSSLYMIESSHLVLKSSDFRMIDNIKMFNFDEFSSEEIGLNSLMQFYSRRHGIGSHVSKILCNHLGISNSLKFGVLPKYEHYMDLSMFFFKRLHLIDTSLSEYVLSRHQFLISLNSLKGVRLLNGLPIYGQRTRSNSRTSSKFPYKLKFKTHN